MAGLDEQCECPLCMEPLEIDDISFYPCTCGYQICRFCWHRIRTDENGLCPACRKQYSEDPAEFKPLTDDELQRIKKERRQKDVQRKQKAAESRKHLANVRVVQRNLVFVVGLSQRLADPEQLKKTEYFGKFGKIHKVVINQSTSYAGAQGPSASAYVTYCRSSDALKAILNVNNVHIDGRTLKASLGTTKYCSHFLKGTQCQKLDCMYLHELGEEAASFTKEEMQIGKHQDYELRLLQQFKASQTSNNNKHAKKASSPVNSSAPSEPTPQLPPPLIPSLMDDATDNNSGWPVLRQSADQSKPPLQSNGTTTQPQTQTNQRHRISADNSTPRNPSPPQGVVDIPTDPTPTEQPPHITPLTDTTPNTTSSVTLPTRRSLVLDSQNHNSLSLFSGDCFTPRLPAKTQPPLPSAVTEPLVNPSIPDIDVSSTTDWQAAFGFSNTSDSQDEDLGFDPLEESAKGLADLLQKEQLTQQQHFNPSPSSNPPPLWPPNMPPLTTFPFPINHTQMPPGFTHPYANHAVPTNNPLIRHDLNVNGSRIMGLMNAQHNSLPPGKPHPFTHSAPLHTDKHIQPQNDMYSTKDWQDGLRALLPNINISFGSNSGTVNQFTNGPTDSLTQPPPWPKPQAFTDTEPALSNHRLPFVQQFSLRGTAWPPQTRNPPPGFSSMPPTHNTDQHTVTDPLL